MTTAIVALAIVQTSNRNDTQEGTCGVWQSKDALSSVLKVIVWELTDDVPVRSEYGFPYMFSVEKTEFRSESLATGYARTLEEACDKAASARLAVLLEAVREAKPQAHNKEKLEQASKR